MATVRSVESACPSSALAGITSTPPGQRSRRAPSALLELEAGDEAEDVVRLLLLAQPVLVRAVLDLRLLIVFEVARRGFLDDLVPDRRGEPVVLLAARAGIEVEELVLGSEVGEHAPREPSDVAALVLRGAVLAVLLRHLGEVGAAVERLVDVGDLLQLRGERLKVSGGRARGGDLDHRDVHLGGRRGDRLVLPLFGDPVADDVVAAVRLDVSDREAGGEPALHHVVLGCGLALLDLDDVVAEVALHRIGDRADRQRVRRVLERLHKLALPDPAELAAGILRTGILGVVLGELVPEVLVVRVLAELVADRRRLRQSVVCLECLIGGVLVDEDEDVAATELAEVGLVTRVDRVLGGAGAFARRLRVEDRVLLDRVEGASLVLRLLLRDLRIVLVAGRDAELDVEARLLVFELGLPVAHRDDPTVEAHRRLEVVLVVLVARCPRDEADDEEEDRREDRDVERLLASLTLPAGEALPTGETWKWDPASHLGDLKCTSVNGDRFVRRAVPRERRGPRARARREARPQGRVVQEARERAGKRVLVASPHEKTRAADDLGDGPAGIPDDRSEERRVGKEGMTR